MLDQKPEAVPEVEDNPKPSWELHRGKEHIALEQLHATWHVIGEGKPRIWHVCENQVKHVCINVMLSDQHKLYSGVDLRILSEKNLGMTRVARVASIGKHLSSHKAPSNSLQPHCVQFLKLAQMRMQDEDVSGVEEHGYAALGSEVGASPFASFSAPQPKAL